MKLPQLQLNINSRVYVYDGDPDMPLLWALRDILGLKGTKFGCGKGLCGACTIHIDEDAVKSCLTPVRAAAGHKITTIEGLSADGSHPLQVAWQEFQVPQCGYCQAGQIMCAAAMLKTHPNPSDEQIDTGMAGNICRCGTYPRIRKAIKLAAEKLRTYP